MSTGKSGLIEYKNIGIGEDTKDNSGNVETRNFASLWQISRLYGKFRVSIYIIPTLLKQLSVTIYL